jgi:ribulose-phosphate 3-epimerase
VSWLEWVRGTEAEPSIYAADFADLTGDLGRVMDAGTRIFHFDVGDGHFVEPITMGPIVLESISPIIHAADGKIDVHLMVDEPVKHFAAVAAAGGDSVTFHIEAVDDVRATIRAARAQELQVGIAFNPETEPEAVLEFADAVDLVLCMSINPGYSGQQFQAEAYERVRRLRASLPASVVIQVDGGIKDHNVKRLYDEGARLLVAASAIFGREDLTRAYRRLVQLLQ